MLASVIAFAGYGLYTFVGGRAAFEGKLERLRRINTSELGFPVPHQDLWVRRDWFVTASRRVYRIRANPEVGNRKAHRRECGASFGLGPWFDARVGSHRCPILRPGRESL